MAKQIVNSILVNVFDVYWRMAMNFGRHQAIVDNEAKRCEHAVMLAIPGWDRKEIVPITELDADGLTDVRRCIEDDLKVLQNTLNESEYKTATPVVKLSIEQRLTGFKALWYPNGELRLPKYEGVACFQRGKAIPDAISLLIAEGKSAKEALEHLTLPVSVETFKNQAERVKMCVMENTRKDAGRVSIMKHWPSLFKAAHEFYIASGGTASMSEINQLLAGGIVKDNNDGIKVHSLLTLDVRFPQLKIGSKLVEAGVDKDGVDLGQRFGESLDRTKVWKLVQHLDSKKAAADFTEGKKDTPNATTDVDVAEYLANPAKPAAEKPVSKAQMNDRMNKTPNLFEKFIWHVACSGKLDLLIKLTPPTISLELLAKCNDLAKELGLANEKGEIIK